MLIDFKAAYIYTPGSVGDHTPSRLAKRRKVGKSQGSHPQPSESAFYTQFEPQLNNLESPECAALRRDLFEQTWSATERRIQVWSIKG
jgi:origin recognition complex subunit 3